MRRSASTSAEASSDAISTHTHLSSSVNALYACSLCGDLCIIYADNWSFSLSRSSESTTIQKWRRPTDIKSFCYKIDQKEWYHEELFNKICKHFKKKKYQPPFPLCNTCASTVLQRIKSRIQFLLTSQQLFVRLDIGDKSVLSENLCLKINEITNETSAFHDARISSEKQTQKIEEEGLKGIRLNENLIYLENLENWEKEYSIPLEEEVRLPIQYNHSTTKSDEITNQKERQRNCFSSLTLSVVFHIGCDRHFGTINCMRLGQTSSKSIPFEEINSGFVVFFHLIHNICRLAKFDDSSLKFGNGCSINGIDLNAEDMNSRRGVAHFNKAIHELFKFCENLFNIQLISSNSLIPPFRIESENRSIATESYAYEYNDPSKWTTAMKYLLSDFIYIQCQPMISSMQEF